MAVAPVIRLGVLVLLTAIAGCSSPNPNLYTIASVAGPVENGTPKVVLVREIVVARYLERTQIVRSTENYRLSAMSNDWWGEPLAAMLSRVLVQELRQRLPRTVVYGNSSPLSLSPEATIDLSIERLDEDASGNVLLQGQAGILFKGHGTPLTRSFRFAVAPPVAGTAGEVAAISSVVGRLANDLAMMLVAGPFR